MSLSDQARQLLRELGFSESECSIYFYLLEKTSGEAVDNVLASSRTSTMETETAIKNLVERGLVKIASNRLEASEPKLFIHKLQELKRLELTRNLELLNSKTARLLSVLEPQYWEARLGLRPEDLLEPLSTLEEMEVRTVRVIGNSTREVSISAESFGWFGKIQEEAYRAFERGVRFRVLMTTKDHETRQRLAEVKTLGMEVRQPKEDWYPVRGTLGDDKELVFLIWTAREKDIQRAKYFRPHYSKNPGMISVFADAFERRWEKAKPI